MKIIKDILGWSLIRKLQATFGIFLLVSYAGNTADFTSLGFGLFFMAQAVFNWGCPMSTCASPASGNHPTVSKEEDVVVSYEEVKSN